jgi:tetratricopeptide (TPR) repeat protein
VHTVRAVLDRHDIEPIVRAQALHEMARLASLGDVQIASKAIPFDTRAIEIADRMATSKDEKVRIAAKQLLVEAHMAVAEEIARQAFNQKVESLSLWVGRASGLAEEYIANDSGSITLRLLIAQRALGALASFKPTLDPAPWVAEAEEAANALFAQSKDELWQQHIKWQLGLAYLNALRVEHSRRASASALRYGQLAVEHLAEGALSRQAVHSSEQLVAQLYFHMGAVYAVHQQDHQKAMPWYDKAVPLLTGPRPVSDLYSPRREGEMLVSIGVTCWQIGQQARALEVTRSGVNLVEMAVEDGILAKSALAVPYGNLASMYEQMGEPTNAAKYSELAKSVAAPAVKTAAANRPGTSATAARQNGRAIQTNAQQVGRNSSRR